MDLTSLETLRTLAASPCGLKPCQGLVFSNGYDPVLKQALKNRKTISEALEYGGINELVQDELVCWSVSGWHFSS